MKQKNRGITLLALVITIIVLLILAGISIAMLTGDNSIIKQAGNAKEITDQRDIEEKVQFAYLKVVAKVKGEIQERDLDQELRKYFTDYHISDDLTKVEINGKDYYFEGGDTEVAASTHTETVNGIEINVPIPSGFTKSTVAGETSVVTGLVVRDSSNNEYVWIPVFEKDSTKCTWGADYTAVRSATEGSAEYYTAIETALKDYTSTYKDERYLDVWFGDDLTYGQFGYYDGTKFVYYSNGNMTSSQYTALYHGMLKSVYENGGFYIGRYEMGIAVVNNENDAKNNTRIAISEYTPSSARSNSTDNTSSTSKVSISGMAAPLSKPNAVAYTCITQSQAEMLAEKLNYSSVTSSMMFGIQWDAVCVYLEHFGKVDSNATESAGTNLTTSDFTRTSNLWGNYKSSIFRMNRGFYSTDFENSTGVNWNQYNSVAKEREESWLCTTGGSNQNRACNIYDFAGNLAEWTLERSRNSLFPCVCRGNTFYTRFYVSYRDDNYEIVGWYRMFSKSFTLYR